MADTPSSPLPPSPPTTPSTGSTVPTPRARLNDDATDDGNSQREEGESQADEEDAEDEAEDDAPCPPHLKRSIGHEAVWTLSSSKPGNSVAQIRDNNKDTYVRKKTEERSDVINAIRRFAPQFTFISFLLLTLFNRQQVLAIRRLAAPLDQHRVPQENVRNGASLLPRLQFGRKLHT